MLRASRRTKPNVLRGYPSYTSTASAKRKYEKGTATRLRPGSLPTPAPAPNRPDPQGRRSVGRYFKRRSQIPSRALLVNVCVIGAFGPMWGCSFCETQGKEAIDGLGLV